jgi:hypothetical protein
MRIAGPKFAMLAVKNKQEKEVDVNGVESREIEAMVGRYH